MKRILYLLFVLLTVSASTQAQTLTPINPEKMIVRIAEIEVYPEYLTEYLEFANGHEFLLHKPVTLFGSEQNVFVSVL